MISKLLRITILMFSSLLFISTAMAQEICDDGIDNDGDGLIDCYDPDCYASDECDFYDADYCRSILPDSKEFGMQLDNNFLSGNYQIQGAGPSYNYAPYGYDIPKVADIDNDGNMEIVTVSSDGGNDGIFIFDPINDELKYFIGLTIANNHTGVTLADIDDDPYVEIIIATGNEGSGSNEIYRYDFNGSAWDEHTNGNWPITNAYTRRGFQPDIFDFNEDGTPEMLFYGERSGSKTAKIYKLDDGSELIDIIAETGGGAGHVASHLYWKDHYAVADVIPAGFDPGTGALSYADGLEFIVGTRVYTIDIEGGNLEDVWGSDPTGVHAPWVSGAGGDGDAGQKVALGDINIDGDLDIIVTGQGRISVWDPLTNASICNTALLGGGSKGGIACIGDVDGDVDNQPEIGVVSREYVEVFRYNSSNQLEQVWGLSNSDNSGETACNFFDFEGDGSVEMVYRDETDLWVYEGEGDGSGGAAVLLTSNQTYNDANGLITNVDGCSSNTGSEHPIIVDVDQNNRADIVVACEEGLRVYRDRYTPWISSRGIFNQRSYSHVNIKNDMTIPAVMQKNHIVPSLNNYLTQMYRIDKAGLPFYPAPDFTIEVKSIDNPCHGLANDEVDFVLNIFNYGDGHADDFEVPITFYDGDPSVAGARILKQEIVDVNLFPLNTKETHVFNIKMSDLDGDGDGMDANIYITINDNVDSLNVVDGSGYTTVSTSLPNSPYPECDYDNNTIGPFKFSDCTLKSPIISLDEDQSSDVPDNVHYTDYVATYNEDAGKINISDVDVNITDDGTNIASAIIEIYNPLDGTSYEGLFWDNAALTALGISTTDVQGATYVEITGVQSKADYESAIELFQYENTSNIPNLDDRIVVVRVTCDNDGLTSGSAICHFSVVGVNDAPISANKTVTTDRNVDYTYKGSDFDYTDPDDDAQTGIQITTLPAKGDLFKDANLDGTLADPAEKVATNDLITLNELYAGKLIFRPDVGESGLSGSDYEYTNFTFKVGDGTVYSSDYISTIRVLPTNNLPTASDNSKTINEDTDHTFLDTEFGFADTDAGDVLNKLQLTSTPAEGTLYIDTNSNGTVDGGEALAPYSEVLVADITGSNFKFKPAANGFGTPYGFFNFKVHDGIAYSASAYKFTFNVSGSDDAPSIDAASVSIDEDVPNTTSVHDVNDSNTNNDTDADDQVLSYSITAGNGSGIFTIDVNTGEITVLDNSNLDYETTTSYVLTIQATDGTNTDNATITVNINNVNDNNPVIVNATTSISENASNGDAVYDVNDDNTGGNTDADGEALTFSITAGNGDGIFAIDPATGAITIADNTNLDYESATSYTLTIQASDGTNTDAASITVNITNENDSNPVIVDATTSISENASNGDAVFDVNDDNTGGNTDADGDAITFSITAGNGDGIFAIDAATGAITVTDNTNLDYESATSYTLTIQASDGTNTDAASITVNITNVNDNNPVIVDATTSISENASNGDAVFDVNDDNTGGNTDADGEAITFSITAGNGDGIFGINAATGAITVTDNTNLDYESATSYTLTIQASDGTNTDVASITVNITNVNDNNPVIVDATTSISENASNGDAVYDVNDDNTGGNTDADGEAITFSITAGNGDGIFGINAATGAITVTDNTNLDYESATSYTLTIQASDGTNTDVASITVNITNENDSNPVIVDATTSISENASNGDAVFDVNDDNTGGNTDADGDAITFSITAGNGDGIFTIDANTGAITVADNTNLDYESATSYSLTIQASDGTNTDGASITVNITNVNDNNPVIVDATTSISENASNSDAVYDVNDDNTGGNTDADGEALTFSITAGNGDGIFAIDPATGAITIADNTNLDYESATSYTLTIQTSDGTNTDGASITVNITNVNDNNPVIVDATTSISENASNSDAVYDVNDDNTGGNTDADGEALTFSITAGNGDGIFAIDPATGAITIADNTNLDYENATSHTLTIQASDGTNTDVASITVNITNVNDNNPVIVDATTSISENASNGDAVYDVNDDNTGGNTDADGDAITFSITAGNADGIFAIDANTGAITVADNTNLDYESATSYTLTIQASDGTNTDVASITVNITNVNDNNPVIVDATTSISENASNGDAVYDVNDDNTGGNTDADGEAITFSITAGNGDGIFTIDANTGAITVTDNTNLDYESATSYTLTIQASDGTNTDAASITVNITNVNDNNPVIVDATTSISENASNGDAVFDVNDDNTGGNTDADGEAITFSITAGNGDGIFGINAATGAITVTDNTNLDYESATSYTLTIQASDGTNTDVASITVNITNVNDNNPVIVDATTSISENASNGDAVYDVNDDNTGGNTDADGEAITFSITAGNGDGIFGINAATGAITVTDNTNLDYESATSYTLTIQASDGTNTDVASITVNITNENDSNPVIVDATTSISENASNGDAVFDVNDDNTGGNTDADGDAITFSITAGNGDGIFTIDANTGAITVADNTNLDYESATSYTLTIQTSDGTNTDGASITVNITNVNDNNPVIVDATTSISENASNSDAVYDVNDDNTGGNTDADGEALTFSITAGNGDGIFAIDPATGAITIADNTNLDYENATSHTLTIQASDGTNTDVASITVNITNVNDNNPVIVDATTSISENASNGDAVYDVNDDNTGGNTDADGDAITFSITAGNADGIFAIDANTGAITVADNTNLDYESATSYTLTIQASDGTSTDGASITVNITNVNDNNPVIVDATTSISENAANGDAVFDVNDDNTGGNTDADGEAITFSITAGNGDGIFGINAATGAITVTDNTNLDYESATSYTLTIQASDGTNTDVASITVNITNVNDSNPVIVDATTSISENASNGDAVFDVNDDNTGGNTDADGDAITFSITAGNADGIFAIDANTGAITVADNTNLDYESATSYTLTIQASDGTNTDGASITVNITNVNDNNPVIVDATTSISENASNSDAVYDVNDDNTGGNTDADGEAITFSIAAGNGDGIFTIDANTGAITVADNTNLDYESATSYTLTIQASDGTNTDGASITVNITNVNDNNPVIVDATTSISENASNGDAVFDVNDDNTGGNTDADGEALTFTINGGNADGIFIIDPATGAITITDNTSLDYENATSYVLTIQASDGTNTDAASITVNITNENDNNPVIVDATTSISENASNGDAVFDVNDDNTGGNTDADGEALTFTINGGNADGIFTIDPATGAITIADNTNLDYETTNSYVLTVQASDGTNTDVADITVNITNENDNNPVIVDATTSISENASNGDAVFDVNDDNTGGNTDADGEALTFTITGGNADGIFIIDPATGAITITDNTSLDYENATSYVLTIQASDGTNTDLANITVNITNENDNNPVIVDATTSISENASNGDAVYDVNDDNTGGNTDADGEALTFSITGGNTDGIFTIDPATGAITITDNTNLDYETTNSYVLTVQASDGTNTDVADITVNITDAAENGPVISDGTSSISENAADGTSVYDVNDNNTGNDTDADGQTLTYSITGGNADGVFTIEPTTGEITIADNTNLDYESTPSYVLTVQAEDTDANTDLANITVNISNENDNNPVIVDASTSISENASDGDAVYDVNDDNTGGNTDADGEALTFSITGGNTDGIFTIDPATGAITIADNTNLDYETTNSYVLTVQASDGTNTDVADITVNITNENDNNPVIVDATTSISENASNGDAVYDVDDDNTGGNTDADGEALTFTITGGNSDGIFIIDPATGAITITDNTNLDYENATSYVLTIQASDGINTDLANITVNITNENDNNPVIVDATTSISENASNGDAVYDVNDDNTGGNTDADGEALTFSITGGNTDGIFIIDPATGAITIADNTNLDYETTNSYVLTVQASDGTNTDVADITVNITDAAENGPVISDGTSSISENAADGVSVYDVNDNNTGNDTDADGQTLTYSITGGNADGVFTIEPTTGEITIADNTNLDYESTPSYVLTVQAEDTDANTDFANITVNISNENDNNPVIVDATTSISENASNGDAVFDVNDDNTGGNTDADGEALTFTINGGNADGIFTIDPATGAITIADNTNLDYETTNSYVLTVQASDGTNTDVADITVNITNENDNNPVIVDATTSISENASNGDAVFDVNDDNTGGNTDADGEALTFTITGGNADGIFIIDPATGAITITDNTSLDYENATSYVLTIQASDGTNTDLANITVNITNENDNNPVIVDATTSISENASNGDAVYDVNDDNTGGNTDADGEALTFSITGGNTDGIFTIDPATGAITITDNTNLDYETTNSYVLTVQASDGTNTDVADITVNITDAAENGPVISDGTSSISENAADGTSVYDVNDNNTGNDTDADGQTLTYSITGGNADGVFTIEPTTGEITIADNTNLDYESTPSYVLTVQAEDTDANTDLANITVNISNENDNNPVIVDASTSISENASDGDAVYDVNDDNTGGNTDADGEALTFSITGGNTDGIFTIDPATGAITIADNTNLDYETTNSYVLTVQASDGTNTDVADITVNITNENDNNPVIVDATTSISENASNGDAVYDVDDDNTGGNTDADGEALTFSITGGNTDGIFTIDPATGAITITDNTNLDYETTNSYVLTVQASDGTNTDVADITVNITDAAENGPIISDATTSVAESATNGTSVYDVNDNNTGNDTDADGQTLTYSITGGNDDGIFTIEPATGEITVVDNTNLDYETTTSYVLTVQAEDTDANTDDATITVNITDVAENSPVIVDYTTSISEAVANETDVYDVNDDNTGNDTDADGQTITYAISSGNDDGVFAIDAATGQITIADNSSIDYNSTPSYTLIVEAQDTDANTDNATITINVTELVGNPPVIVDFTTSIAEDATNGTNIHDVNDDNTGDDTDVDGQALTYSITGGNDDGIFTIDPATGEITVVDNTNLDYETTTSYVLTVQAEDTDANTDDATITVNITDVAENSPVIVDYTTSISEAIANETDVYDVNDDNTGNDTDADGQALTYTISSGNDDGVFAIDAATGQITIADNSSIDYNSTPSYTLIVEAQDTDANTDNATITINVTELVGNPPVIVDFTTSIAEDATNGTNIHDVNDDNTGDDTDVDGQALTYSITGGNDDGIFTIDPATGEITVVDNTNLDYETTTSYVLTVQAEDTDANTDDATITVNITDVAENSPVIVDFTTSISEAIANETDVYDVNDDNTGNDTDADGQALTYTISSGNDDGVFAIAASTGQITIADNSSIDYNSTPSYTLIVEAQDTDANTDNATITINVTEVTGNPPVIVDFTTSIAEDATNGTNIHDVNDDNTGDDTDVDGQALTYSITGGNGDGIFTIEPTTGEIAIADNSSLDYESTTSYVLTVQAEDTDVNTDDATITVNITDVAENSPVIVDFTTSISEAIANETDVYDVNDDNTGNDTDADGQALTYTISSGNDDGVFAIDAATGQITIADNSSIDYNSTPSYTLIVEAQDTDANTDNATITINVTELVGNPPVIVDFTTSIAEDATNGTNIHDVNDDNTGDDTDVDGQALTYSITGGNADGIFTIDAGTGEMTVVDNTNLDYETTTSYVLTVQAEDTDANTDDATITVNITDVAENSPVIVDFTTSISEAIANETDVYDVNDDNTGNDTDADGQALTYTISSGNDDGVFAIDAATGQITIAENSSIDYNSTPSYTLIVEAQDTDANTDNATITINVTEVTGNPPVIVDFTTSIAEDASIGTNIHDVNDDNTGDDTDVDGQALTYSITGGNGDGIFTIDPATGEITVVDNNNLDYETTTSYILTVQAEDTDANTDDATITVNITDVAENSPVIVDFTTSISEAIANETDVYDVNDDNTGNDTDADGQALTYTISSGNDDGVFAIAASTGQITIADNSSIDYNSTPSYILIVEAQDTDANTDNATITINVTEVVGNPPVIVDFTTSIAEDATNGTNIHDVNDDNTGNDTDEDGQALTYSITSGNDDGIFAIDPATGEITVVNNTNLDYETTTSYVLTVQAEDTDVNTDDATITVNITDVEESNNPDIADGSAYIDEDAENGTFVYDIDDVNTTEDVDADGQSLTYEIINGNDEGIFNININSGEITVGDNSNLDYEEMDRFDIMVKATDIDSNSDQATISIHVLDKTEAIKVPEGFSPNSDGYNDFFEIKGVIPTDKVEINIYNRWGTLVYESKNYNNNWDGKANANLSLGNDLPSGTYFYIIKINGNSKELSGNVYMKR